MRSVLYWFTPPAPKVTGVGSSPELPLRIKHASKDNLQAVEASWLFRQYAGPNEVMDDKFYQRLKFETQQADKKVYDVATLTMADGTVRVAYFDVTNYRRCRYERPCKSCRTSRLELTAATSVTGGPGVLGWRL